MAKLAGTTVQLMRQQWHQEASGRMVCAQGSEALRHTATHHSRHSYAGWLARQQRPVGLPIDGNDDAASLRRWHMRTVVFLTPRSRHEGGFGPKIRIGKSETDTIIKSSESLFRLTWQLLSKSIILYNYDPQIFSSILKTHLIQICTCRLCILRSNIPKGLWLGYSVHSHI